MEKSRVIVIAVIMAIVAIGLAIAGVLYFSWISAVREENARLEQFAQDVIVRANVTLDQSKDVLKTIDAKNFRSCSDEHLQFMRTQTFNATWMEEIGFFQHGVLKCTSWGLTQTVAKESTPDFTMPDGFKITLRMQPVMQGSEQMMAVQYGAHNVLINPLRFVDIISEPNMKFAVATSNGAILGASYNVDSVLIRQAITNPRLDFDEDNFIARARKGGLVAIAIEPRSELLARWHTLQKMLLPLGALFAAAMIGIIYWLSRRRLSPLGELHIAVKKKEFIVLYQPIIDLNTGSCVGAEALIRWKRPDGKVVAPDYFIPLAEESGLIFIITDQIIHDVIKSLKNLLQEKRKLHIAINLCAEDIKTGRFLDVFQSALENSAIETQQIWLEATERGFIDIDGARKTLTRAREAGFGLAIDDFGTGYSSLSLLQGVPLDALKIDKSFVDAIETESATSSVTPHIIEMAKALGLKIIAEGVESQAQVNFLLQHQVEFGQGWFYSKALSAADFIAYCRHNP